MFVKLYTRDPDLMNCNERQMIFHPHRPGEKKAQQRDLAVGFLHSAEKVGFEPTVARLDHNGFRVHPLSMVYNCKTPRLGRQGVKIVLQSIRAEYRNATSRQPSF